MSFRSRQLSNTSDAPPVKSTGRERVFGARVQKAGGRRQGQD